jgi:hypothetical protein
MARRSKYTPEVVQRVVQAIELGATYELACGYAGISHETFAQWRRSKPEFLEAVKEAEGRAAVKWLAKIEQAASDGTWQAAAWKLERRHPHDYGRTITEHQGNDDAPVAIRLIRRGG